MSVSETRPQSAIERTLELLATPPAAHDVAQGWIDLLGPDGRPEEQGLLSRLMHTGVLPVVYERWWRPGWGFLLTGLTPGAERRLTLELLDLRPGDAVLDVACGPGNYTREFARAVGPGGLAVGIDGSMTMLGRAVADTGEANVAYVRGDAVRLPFRDESFDAVCCFAALHLFGDAEQALDHMARVLKPGGRLALFTSRRRDLEPLGTLDELAGRISGPRMFRVGELDALLAERGFTGIRRRTAGVTQIVGARRPDGRRDK